MTSLAERRTAPGREKFSSRHLAKAVLPQHVRIDAPDQTAVNLARPSTNQENSADIQTRFDIIRGGFEILPSPYFQPLRPSEKKVLALKLKGKTAKEIAAELVISTRTVDNHCYSIYAKWGIKNQADLAIKAFRLNLVSIDELKKAIGYDPKNFAQLTPRELEILSLFAQGYDPSEVAEKLNRSEKTINNFSASIHQKLNIFNEIGIITAFLIREKEK